MALTSEELERLALQAFGPGWQSALARERGVAIRTVQRWAAGGIAKPDTAEAIATFLTTRRVFDLPSPGGDRAEAAKWAMVGLVAAVEEAGQSVGWRPGELSRALNAAKRKRKPVRNSQGEQK